MLMRINPEKPDSADIYKVAAVLRAGGIIIYPTDTVYGLGCDIYQQKAIERLCRIKGLVPEKANLSIVCHDLSHLADFTKPISTSIFRVLKKALPGPYTFILQASAKVPKLFQNNRKSVGIRVPDNRIAQEIVKALGNPIVSTSIHDLSDELLDYYADPDKIAENYNDKVDIVINGGYSDLQASTVIDCTDGDFTVVRQGLGDVEHLW